MKVKEIQELIDFIAQSGLDEVSIETEGLKLSTKKASAPQFKQQEFIPAPQVVQQPIAAPQATAATAADTAAAATKASDSKFITIKSPMIGTFYRTANPEAPAFANVGDTISKGQTVCIIEAMKLYNEIESEFSGKIVKILVENATPVEYDQPLFLIDPA
jgi:acetyl-CoA carboxylase biotin carboxyl carrier protein